MSRVDDAVQKYLALLELEQSSFSKTTRARNELIRSLDSTELPEFALKLKQNGALTSHDVTR